MGEREWVQALAELEDRLREEAPGDSAEAAPRPGPERLRALAGVLGERNRQLAEQQQDRNELLSTVAHDLRTPLVAIQGFVQLLQRSTEGFRLAEKQHEYLTHIQQAVQQMNRLVDDLRVAGHLEEGRLTLRPAAVNLAEFLDEVLSLQREPARQRGVSLNVRLEPNLPRVAVFDPDRIAQALGNLVQNAVRITPADGQVEVAVGSAANRLLFRVRDSGPGIDPETLPHLFERFVQGRRERAAGRGSGLGLFICREVAALHGGRAAARNPAGGGAEFSLELPLVTVLEEADTEAAP